MILYELSVFLLIAHTILWIYGGSVTQMWRNCVLLLINL